MQRGGREAGRLEQRVHIAGLYRLYHFVNESGVGNVLHNLKKDLTDFRYHRIYEGIERGARGHLSPFADDEFPHDFRSCGGRGKNGDDFIPHGVDF